MEKDVFISVGVGEDAVNANSIGVHAYSADAIGDIASALYREAADYRRFAKWLGDDVLPERRVAFELRAERLEQLAEDMVRARATARGNGW